MRILIYGINYAPELTGIGKYTAEMAEWLVKQGHTVRVITGMPYYPEWRIHQKYRRKLWYSELLEGVTVYRCPLYVPRKVTPMKRILHEFSFLAGVIPVWIKTFFQKKYDTVICISPPFHLGFLPLLYSRLKRCNFITHIQDLQVDAAKNLVMIKNGRLLNMMFGAETYILKKSTLVSTISNGMLEKIKAKKIADKKLVLFPNWVDINAIAPLPVEWSLRKQFGLKDQDKVILYAGNLGEKQGLEILIDVASHFRDNETVHFLIVGSGGNKEKLEKLVRSRSLKNISFHSLVPAHLLPALLATADLHLVLQKKSAADLMMPSKLSGILAAGGCSVVTASPDTSLYKMVNDYGLGFLVEPESPTELINVIAKALVTDLTLFRKNARDYAITYLSMESVMSRFENELQNLMPNEEPLNYQPLQTQPANALMIKEN